jgi:DNA-binding transcriptional LysR family regulator
MLADSQYHVTPGDLQVVLALARGGTLARAAGLLGVDGSTVFRALQRIEGALKQRLFDRSRAGYRASELGQQLVQAGERIEAELEAARAATLAGSGAVAGQVRISTTDSVLHRLVLPALASLCAQHSQLHLDLVASNELASLTHRDADVALRATRKPPGHLIGRALGPIRVALYASSAGPAPAEADWVHAPWLALDDALPEHPTVQWRKRRYPKLTPRFKFGSVLALQDGIAAGLGIGVLPQFLARGRDDLVALSGPLDECETQLWLLTHPESRHLRRIAVVAVHLAAQILLE